MDKTTVMIIDDTIYMRNLLKKILESDAYEVVAEADNGIDAMKFYKMCNPDLVMLDITMPLISGFSVLGKIKAMNPSAKVIMVSAAGHKKNVIDSAKFGASHFIVKPFTREKVLETAALVMEKEYNPKFMVNIDLQALDLKDHVGYADVVSILSNETGIDKEDAEDILSRFLDGIPDIEKKLEESFNEKKFEEIANIAHTLKGALLNIRFRKFSEAAENLDLNAREKKEDLVEKYYKILKEWLEKIKNLKNMGGS